MFANQEVAAICSSLSINASTFLLNSRHYFALVSTQVAMFSVFWTTPFESVIYTVRFYFSYTVKVPFNDAQGSRILLITMNYKPCYQLNSSS